MAVRDKLTGIDFGKFQVSHRQENCTGVRGASSRNEASVHAVSSAACLVSAWKHGEDMKLGRVLLGAGDGVLDRALCVLGTIAFSQIPEFMQQYLQRLGGHLDEARRQLAQFRHTAEQSGLTLDHFIKQTGANSDAAVAKLGGVMTDAVARVDELQAAQTAIQNASLWERPFVFLRNYDPSIGHAAWAIFKPAVPTTVEGLVYALAGMLFLLTFYHAGVKYPIRRVVRLHRSRREAAAYM